MSPIFSWCSTRIGVPVCVAGAALALLAAGCGSSSQLLSGAAFVSVTERDFGITAPKSLAAGDHVLRVANKGPSSHELLVIKIPAAGLAYRSDGLTIDEEALTRDEAGILEPALTGARRDLEVHLTPGRYVLLCNMSGHYLGGMHAIVEVP